jgi:hypothetical protein
MIDNNKNVISPGQAFWLAVGLILGFALVKALF